MREVRDPVHGFIHRTREEEEIIDTPVFQRLRRIKQLAMASLVYPGALHTRFEHSLGVMHLTRRMVEKLLPREDPRDKLLLELAALLHDLGHGPFSHVSEEVLEKYYDRDKVKLAPHEKIHERVTGGLIKHSEHLAPLISESDRNRIVNILSGQWGDQVLKDILSGPIDADKQDYLLRDSYYCGVKYGIFDIDRLVDVLQVLEDRTTKVLAVDVDGVHTLEQFVLAKYYMTTQVYRHKIRLITDNMIVRAIMLGIEEDKIEPLIRLYTFDDSIDFYQEWIKWDDEVLFATICSRQIKDGYAKKIFQSLRERSLHKRIFHKKLSEAFTSIARQELSENFSMYAKDIETRVANLLDIDPNLVIAHTYSTKSVRDQSRNSEGPIMIFRADMPIPFEQESVLFRSINEAEKDEYIDIYAPVTFHDEADKRKKLRYYDETVEDIVNSVVVNVNAASGGDNNGQN
ncbi:HD domain-containing protein [Neomoorella mulderi]|uniref:Deoxyguanosinetriphosphate triphosphohydrolase-like protein n=1 Tax=Moorella mulderi DSM 14980 TaxID=1122241 RepID=A0A151AYQ6_9FIRM|nr:HD domain-containing protein [Moorella mulderi]KYH32794.1 deoxyguanosinetriphosphate triphosphohydrolase-like protein [Moorella mulderi DSM 14980]